MEKELNFNLENTIEYKKDGVNNKLLTKGKGGSLMVFAFDKGKGLAEHKTPNDAIVQLLDGEAEITIGGKLHHLKKGDCIIMPANIPHELKAIKRFKMLLTLLAQEEA